MKNRHTLAANPQSFNELAIYALVRPEDHQKTQSIDFITFGLIKSIPNKKNITSTTHNQKKITTNEFERN